MQPTNDDRMEEVIKAVANGEIVIVTDDDDRENEGDLICAASVCTAEKMAFIIRHGCGIVCAPISHEIGDRLQLTPMVAHNNAPLATAFTVSVDARRGLTTGISATERCNTVRALAGQNSIATDFARPGHIFPLLARPGGLLIRSGHTEAAVDLCRLADLPEVGVICELANDDGTVMKGEQIIRFAEEHKLKSISVSDLIAFRQKTEKLVTRLNEQICKSSIGNVRLLVYSTPFDAVQHFAIVYGEPDTSKPVMTRLHRSDIRDDLLGGGKTVDRCFERFKEAGAGVLIYLRDGGAGVPPMSFDSQPTIEDMRTEQWLEIGVGAQILRDLEISEIDMLSSQSRQYVGLTGFGISVNRSIPID